MLGVASASDETGPALSALGPPTLVGGTGEQRDEVLAGRDRRDILLRVIVDIASDLDLDATLKRIVTGAMELTGARFGALGVRGTDETLISFVHAGIDEVAVHTMGHHPVGNGVLGLLRRRSRSLLLDDLNAHPAAVGFPEHHPSMKLFWRADHHSAERVRQPVPDRTDVASGVQQS